MVCMIVNDTILLRPYLKLVWVGWMEFHRNMCGKPISFLNSTNEDIFYTRIQVILYTKCIAPRKVIENTISHLHDKLYTDSAAQETSRQR
jgi:hypothetical protein